MKKIAIFASGSGTNAGKIIQYFSNRNDVIIDIILSNKKDAYVLNRAKKFGVDNLLFNKKDFVESEKILNLLIERNIDLIVLAGFLWLVPENIIKNFDNKIINIHPALLPEFGGKGMYGDNVHKAVIENKKKISGITIHYVNNKYDEGNIIFQKECPVYESDTAKDLAKRIHILEHKFFPEIIDFIIKNDLNNKK